MQALEQDPGWGPSELKPGLRKLRRALRVLTASFLGASALLALQAQLARRRGYLTLAPDDEFDNSTATHERALRLVVIGDSTAVGVGAGTRRKSYPALLAERVRRHRPVALTVLGRSGLRWQHIPDLLPHVIAADPDIVLIGVGGNDAIHLTPISKLRSLVAFVLDELQSSRATVLVVLGPRFEPPAIPRPLRDLVARRCRAVNRVISAQAADRGVRAIDTESVIEDAFARDPAVLYSEDLFHPSAAGYELWSEAIEQHLVSAALEYEL